MSTVNDQVRIDSDSGGDGVSPLTVPPEDGDRRINLGALHQLVVPEEDLSLDAGGEDLDFSESMLAVVRRPQEQKWFALMDGYWMQTRLVEVADPTSEYGVHWHWTTDPATRSALRGYLRDVMVVPCYLLQAKVWSIWVIRVGDHRWWFEVEPLFRQTPEFYQNYAFRVISDRGFTVKHDLISELGPRITLPQHPTRSVGELLGESLGRDRFIKNMDHPVVRELTRGQILR